MIEPNDLFYVEIMCIYAGLEQGTFLVHFNCKGDDPLFITAYIKVG